MAETENKNIKRIQVTELVQDDRNANRGTDRGLTMLQNSLQRYGIGRGIVVDRAGRIIGGNKTVEQLLALGLTDAVVVPTDGKTLVVTQRVDLDLERDPDARALAYADNRISQVDYNLNVDLLLEDVQRDDLDLSALWNDNELSALLAHLQSDSSAIDDITSAFSPTAGPEDVLEHLDAPTDKPPTRQYSRKVTPPLYEPSGEKPAIQELYDDTKTMHLVREIEECTTLTDAEKRFLIAAAQRHTVFNFSKIADYYAHSDPAVQRLMENSALVIIDINRAIELGFVRLTQRLANIVRDEYGDEDDEDE